MENNINSSSGTSSLKIGAKIHGTDDIITNVGHKVIIGGQEAQPVVINNREYIFIDPKTLEKTTLRIKSKIENKMI